MKIKGYLVWQDWQVKVTSTSAESGGPALLTCVTPAAARDHATVAAWAGGCWFAPCALSSPGRSTPAPCSTPSRGSEGGAPLSLSMSHVSIS
ncbi:unnamed protein product [Leptidea sinapis]|uniref:Uncharacterized protein n=1 Tax=Leptidea sinapis TaxID=189913 RepID=A0A5E4QDB2_9NEOP|nr:unnamed protein product [Leptidea sinapis]